MRRMGKDAPLRPFSDAVGIGAGRWGTGLVQAAHACRNHPPCADVPPDWSNTLAAVNAFQSGYRVRVLRRGRCSIQFAVALLDASGAEMALHSDADMVRSIVGARQVKLLSGPTGSQCQDALA
jgi:hypothetical protein